MTLSNAILSADINVWKGAFQLDMKLRISPGLTAIVGPSGAGKTSLLNLIAGIDRDGDTDFKLNGRQLDQLPPEGRRIAYVFQDALLFPHMSVAKNINYGAKTRNAQDTSRLDELVALFDLEPLMERRPASLSGGEQRRVALARALMSAPELLLLDEPLSGIDPARREAFFPYLERLHTRLNIPVLYVTHQMDEVMRLADDVIVMEAGEIVLQGSLEDIATEEAFARIAGGGNRSVVLAGDLQHNADGLTSLKLNGGNLLLSSAPTGERARVRILARDVAIATQEPEGISILNSLTCVIEDMEPTGKGTGEVDLILRLAAGQTRLISRITRHSLDRLHLQEGQTVWALIKAVAVLKG